VPQDERAVGGDHVTAGGQAETACPGELDPFRGLDGEEAPAIVVQGHVEGVAGLLERTLGAVGHRPGVERPTGLHPGSGGDLVRGLLHPVHPADLTVEDLGERGNRDALFAIARRSHVGQVVRDDVLLGRHGHHSLRGHLHPIQHRCTSIGLIRSGLRTRRSLLDLDLPTFPATADRRLPPPAPPAPVLPGKGAPRSTTWPRSTPERS